MSRGANTIQEHTTVLDENETVSVVLMCLKKVKRELIWNSVDIRLNH
jgi:hypothetical protein